MAFNLFYPSFIFLFHVWIIIDILGIVVLQFMQNIGAQQLSQHNTTTMKLISIVLAILLACNVLAKDVVSVVYVVVFIKFVCVLSFAILHYFEIKLLRTRCVLS